MSLQLLENNALSRGIIGKSAPILSEITIGKSQIRIMLRHCPKRYWAASTILLTCRLLGHIFIKKGAQQGPSTPTENSRTTLEIRQE
jgi:hypothetical protein